MHRRGYEGISTLWKNHGKLKSFQSLVCCHATKLYAAKRASWKKRLEANDTVPFFEKGIVPAAQPSSKVIIMARPPRDKDGMGPQCELDARIRTDHIRLLAQPAQTRLFYPRSHAGTTPSPAFCPTLHIQIGIFSPERVNHAGHLQAHSHTRFY